MSKARAKCRLPRCEDPGELDETPAQEAEFRRRITAVLQARVERNLLPGGSDAPQRDSSSSIATACDPAVADELESPP